MQARQDFCVYTPDMLYYLRLHKLSSEFLQPRLSIPCLVTTTAWFWWSWWDSLSGPSPLLYYSVRHPCTTDLQPNTRSVVASSSPHVIPTSTQHYQFSASTDMNLITQDIPNSFVGYKQILQFRPTLSGKWVLPVLTEISKVISHFGTIQVVNICGLTTINLNRHTHTYINAIMFWRTPIYTRQPLDGSAANISPARMSNTKVSPSLGTVHQHYIVKYLKFLHIWLTFQIQRRNTVKLQPQ